MKRIFGILIILIVSSSAAGIVGYGQNVPPAGQNVPSAEAPDQPAPGVAHVSLLRGEVSVQRGDSNDWVAATLNTPVLPGDKVSTGQGQAELQFDHANVLRLSDQSQANVAQIDRARIQVQLAQGLAFYSVYGDSEAQTEIDTPNVAIHPRGEAQLHIQVNPSGETIVIVRRGEADISTAQGTTLVRGNQMITVRGAAADAQYLTADAPVADPWDRFNDDRDRQIRGAQSWSRVNPYYTGAESLDTYGQWESVPDYNYVWRPAVPAGWAPYRDGNWVWEPYYGWTWVSYEPWGWAPYHYGRWFMWDNSWVWWPGPVNPWYRPIWSPAYVSFFGFGAGHFGLSFGFGFGSIGWFPIGPCDPFLPWYGRHAYRFGFADFHGVHDRFFLHNHPGAFAPLSARFNERFSNFSLASRGGHFLGQVTSVRAEQFGRGVGRHSAGISTADFRGGRVMTGGLPVVPTRASLAPSSRAPSPGTIRNNSPSRFFARSQMPSAPRASFNEQASRVQGALMGNGAPSRAGGAVQRGGTPAVASRPGMGSQPVDGARQSSGGLSRPGATAGASERWRRFGTTEAGAPRGNVQAVQPNRGAAGAARTYSRPAPSYQSSQPASRSAQPSGNSGGWQRFPAGRPAPSNNGAGSQPRYSTPNRGGSAPSYSTRPSTPNYSYGSRPSYGASPSYGARPGNSASPSYSGRPNYSAPQGYSRPGYSAPQSYGSRPSYSAPQSSGAPRGYVSRPPLNMSRPIISGPSRSSAPSRGFGGGAQRGGGSAPRGGSSRPSGSSRRR